LLVGAGQLSQAVSQIAQMLDFEVLVCDPREEYANTPGLSGAIRIPGMPDDAVREMRPDAHTAIVALTHDPKLDDMALLEALRSGAFYVGALGSSRNQATRKKRLAEHFDLTEAELARLHGPVGLRIGAKTPAEIAVSIVAQIVERKNEAVQGIKSAPGCAVA
jgi:xanthine dehydrogenase accessory factor